MALSLICACGARFEVEDTLAGQDVSCPECQQINKAPALRQPALRTSDLALASTVLSLVGAFTIIGSSIAVLLGAIGLVRISRNRERVGGTGFAIFGIAAGTIFTILTLLALSSSELFGLGSRMRRNMLADRVDTGGELTHSDNAGFRITRTSRDWGVSNAEKLEDAYVYLLRGRIEHRQDFLLVHTRRNAYVDVRVERRPVDDPKDVLTELVKELVPANRFDPSERNMFRVIEVKQSPEMKTIEGGEGVRAVENTITIQCTGQKWKMIVRVYATADRMFVVRGYGPASHLRDDTEKDVRKVMDSFAIIDEK